jgi:hypothetical protein
MKPSAKNLALRDPARALLLGALSVADFGAERGQADFGIDFGWEFGDDDYGADAAAAIVPAGIAAAAPSPQAVRQMWGQVQQEKAVTARRAMLLEPNKNSRVKVERYTFSVEQELALGTSETLNMTGQPDTNIRPQRVTSNSPAPGFVTLSDIKVANVSVSVGGSLDSFQFNANGVGQHLDMPTLTPANRARVTGSYTGFTPPGYTNGGAYLFIVAFTGPASIVA